MWTEGFQKIKSNNSDLSHEAEGDEEKNTLPADGNLQLLSTEPFITCFLDGGNTKTEEKEFSAPDDAGDNLEEIITTGCQTR